MENTVTLKDHLNSLLKKELVILAGNYNIDQPNKLKKAELVGFLDQFLKRQFVDDIIYFTADEALLFADGFKGMMKGLDLDQLMEEADLKDNEDFPIREFLENMDVVRNDILTEKPEILINLASRGYIFIKEGFINPVIEIPIELKALYLKKTEELRDVMVDYQTLQMYVAALTNLYGVCTYNQLHKVFKKYTGSKLSLKKVKDYITEFSNYSDVFATTSNYFFSSSLKAETYMMIVNSDLKRRYYMPTEDEINYYAFVPFGPEVELVVENIRKIILERTAVYDDLNDELITYEEALGHDEDITLDYEDLMDDLVYSARLGIGLLPIMERFDLMQCRFDSLKDMNNFYKSYLELEKKTRKWTLKGALYSEL
jgi:hypothetical protein